MRVYLVNDNSYYSLMTGFFVFSFPDLTLRDWPASLSFQTDRSCLFACSVFISGLLKAHPNSKNFQVIQTSKPYLESKLSLASIFRAAFHEDATLTIRVPRIWSESHEWSLRVMGLISYFFFSHLRDPASLLRHRKRLHCYIPGSAAREERLGKNRNKHKRICHDMWTCYSAIGSDSPGSASVTASQFLLFLLLERVDSEHSLRWPILCVYVGCGGIHLRIVFPTTILCEGIYYRVIPLVTTILCGGIDFRILLNHDHCRHLSLPFSLIGASAVQEQLTCQKCSSLLCCSFSAVDDHYASCLQTF